MSNSSEYFGGCEGGASHSKVAIVNKNGNILSEVEGDGTNQWLIGMEECCKRIHDLFCEAKEKAGISKDTCLKSIGLSLSGADSAENQSDISQMFMKNYQNDTLQCLTCNDTLGPLVTATEGAGVVLIAGTGSNCLLCNPSGSTINCGGWGHIIGDYGSANWIVLETLRTIYEDHDGFNRCPFDTTFLKKSMFEYFQMKDMFDILPYLHPAQGKQMNKEFIAKFCLKGVVQGALVNDKLSLHIFSQAGEVLGKHVKALIPKMESSLLSDERNSLKIICVGSVWKSWDFLKKGFLKGIAPQTDEEKMLKSISMLKLKPGASTSVGVAAWAARKIHGDQINLNYEEMAEVFFTHRF